ncbi:uncharacterized protein LOC115759161 [Drosophila novamexicana]|uniref:uncharacterized protein LOC115759161 n=1 Tax=Drosophila novamexicana TaxID=47314 RepID=UPI0011E5B4CD|nr:uncharacterized protein LOC115759161 [Drosophila novamexicana]
MYRYPRMRKQHMDHITPYDVMQIQNCKTFAFRKGELYPSIIPPVSRCDSDLTAKWLCNAINDSGCGTVEPRVLQKMQKSRNEKIHLQRTLDDGQSSTEDMIPMLKYKKANFQQWENYPSIRPPISPCGPELAKMLDGAVMGNDSQRLFDMEQDDIMEVWRRSPNKDTLGYYGIGSDVHKPEAIDFNQVIKKCLDKVNPQLAKEKSKTKLTQLAPKSNEQPKEPQGAFLLNRQMLKSKINKLIPEHETLSDALGWVHCTRSFGDNQPLFRSEPKISVNAVLDTERPSTKTKYELRRRRKHCQDDIAANQCTEFERKRDPSPYELAYQREMEQLEKEIEAEPKNYDQLYSQLVTCFEKNTYTDPISEAYKCCQKSSVVEDEDDGAGASGDGRAGRDAGHRSTKTADMGAGDGTGVPVGATGGAGEGAGNGAGGGEGDGPGGGAGDGAVKGTKPSITKAYKQPRKSSKKSGQNKAERKQNGTPLKKNFELFRNTSQSGSGTIPSISVDKPSGPEPSRVSLQTKERPGTKMRLKRKKGRKAKKLIGRSENDNVPIKDCTCEVCKFMDRRESEPDSPLIRQMKGAAKQRERWEYFHSIRQHMKFCGPEYRASQHKCAPIACDNSFCYNRKWSESLDRLAALQKLQRLIGPRYENMDRDVLDKLKFLRNRICQQMCDFITMQRTKRNI